MNTTIRKYLALMHWFTRCLRRPMLFVALSRADGRGGRRDQIGRPADAHRRRLQPAIPRQERHSQGPRLGRRYADRTEGSHQAATYDLSEFAVFMASNSGRTKEVVLLARQLAQQGNQLRLA